MQRDKKDLFENTLRTHLFSQNDMAPEGPCPDENWMAAYVEDTLGSSLKTQFERHLLQCGRCQTELAMLVRTEPAHLAQSPLVEQESSQKQSWLAIYLGWMSSAALKPALAIFAVSLLAATLGYRWVREQAKPEFETVKVANQILRLEQPSADKLQQKNGGETTRAGRAQPQLEPATPKLLERSEFERQRTSIQTRQADSVEGNTDQAGNERVKETYSSEPPAYRGEGGKALGTLNARRDDAVLPEDSIAPKSSAQDLKKDAATNAERVKAEDARQSRRVVDGPVVGTISQTAQSKAAPAAAAAPPATFAVSSVDSEKKTERDSELPARAIQGMRQEARKQKAPAEASTQIAAETKSANRLFAGGKQFELRQGVWHDVSITADEVIVPREVLVRTREYETHQNALAPFQAVLARPEDVLIKLSGTIYRIRKRP